MATLDPKNLFDPPLTEAQYEALSEEAKAFLARMVEIGFSFPYDKRPQRPASGKLDD